MRGKAIVDNIEHTIKRITPAHAGKSLCKCRAYKRGQDHPRTCGEKWLKAIYSVTERGSPPHMRGKALPYFVQRDAPRITPAHAGKSLKKLQKHS